MPETGGFSDFTRDERCVSLNEPRIRIASLNMGSANVGETVYINTLPDIRYWANIIKKKGIIPELEVFDFLMIQQCCRLREEGLLPEHLHFNFCFGFPGAISADPQHLAYLVLKLPEKSSFGIIHDGMHDLTLLAAAVAFGAVQIRVGYEDSFYCFPNRPASSNAELVQAAVQMVRSMGREVADFDYARHIWLDYDWVASRPQAALTPRPLRWRTTTVSPSFFSSRRSCSVSSVPGSAREVFPRGH